MTNPLPPLPQEDQPTMRSLIALLTLSLAGASWLSAADQPAAARKTKIVFIAGVPSHLEAEHEHFAGCTLLAKCLNESLPNVEATVFKCEKYQKNDYTAAIVGADTIIVYGDGEKANPVFAKTKEVTELLQRGVGLGCIHYAVEGLPGEKNDQLKNWIGGCFEPFWSVNPHWTAEFTAFPQHPVANGLKPFAIEDEWYFNMRFVEPMAAVTPILTAIPPDKARRLDKTDNNAHTYNEHARAQKGRAEHVAWVYERAGGGRGFGFTGGHWHWNWANPNVRTMVLNAIVWSAKLEVPAGGVPVKALTYEEMSANLDVKKGAPRGAKTPEQVRQLIDTWNAAALGPTPKAAP